MYLGLQVSADGGYERDVLHRMNEGYRAWGELKSVLRIRGLEIMAKKCLYEGVIVPTALYEEEAWGPANTPLLVQYCPNNVARLRRVWTENV